MIHKKTRTTQKKISDFLSSHNRRLRKLGLLNEELPSVEEMEIHLSEQLKEYLLCSWNNYGKVWQIDHIIPFNNVKNQDDAKTISKISNFHVRYLEVNQNHQLITQEHKQNGDKKYEKKFKNKLMKMYVKDKLYKKMSFKQYKNIVAKTIKEL